MIVLAIFKENAMKMTRQFNWIHLEWDDRWPARDRIEISTSINLSEDTEHAVVDDRPGEGEHALTVVAE